MPLTTQQLEALLRDIESDRVERKSSLADRERFLEAICAFANDLPDHRQEIGISLARAELSRNGNPEPEFQPEDSHLLVIVRKRP